MIIIILFCTLLFPIQIVMTSASKRTKLIYTYSFSCNKKAQRAQTQLFLLDYDKDDDNHAEVDAFLLFFYSVAILHQYGAWTEAAPAAATIIRATTSGTSKWIPIQKKNENFSCSIHWEERAQSESGTRASLQILPSNPAKGNAKWEIELLHIKHITHLLCFFKASTTAPPTHHWVLTLVIFFPSFWSLL